MNLRTIALLIAIALLAVGWQHERGNVAIAEKALSDYKLEVQGNAAKANQGARQTENTWGDAQRKVVQDAVDQRDKARLDADNARAAGRVLRNDLATAYAKLRAAEDTGTTSTGTTAEAAARVLANVSGGAIEAEDAVARFADESRIAGLACERIADGLAGK